MIFSFLVLEPACKLSKFDPQKVGLNAVKQTKKNTHTPQIVMLFNSQQKLL